MYNLTEQALAAEQMEFIDVAKAESIRTAGLLDIRQFAGAVYVTIGHWE
jgi:hypothetical protein